jgi:transcription antitermination factor NusG
MPEYHGNGPAGSSENPHAMSDGQPTIQTALGVMNPVTPVADVMDILQWYAIYTYSRHEKRVAVQLQARGIEAFLPLYRCTHRWKTGLTEVHLPLFPGYAFVHICLRRQLDVLQVPGVVSLVGMGAQALALPEQQIERLRAGLSLLNAQPYPYVAVGDRVRIVQGPLKGLEGLLVRVKRNYRVAISIDLIQRSLSVEVELGQVECIPQSRSPQHLPAALQSLSIEGLEPERVRAA